MPAARAGVATRSCAARGTLMVTNDDKGAVEAPKYVLHISFMFFTNKLLFFHKH